MRLLLIAACSSPETSAPATASMLAARATRAFLEYAPMRWYSQEEVERVYRHIPYGRDLDVFVNALDLAEDRVEGMLERPVNRVALGGPELVEIPVDLLPGFGP